MYELLKYVHIVCAVIWVGGSVYAQLLAVRASRSSNPVELPLIGRQAEAIGQRVFVPIAVVLLLAGSAMTLQRWSFGQTWIAIAVALWVLSAVSGAAYIGPRAKRVAELFEAEGPESAAARALLGRVFLVSRLELVSFAVIIALMVYKPTL